MFHDNLEFRVSRQQLSHCSKIWINYIRSIYLGAYIQDIKMYDFIVPLELTR